MSCNNRCPPTPCFPQAFLPQPQYLAIQGLNGSPGPAGQNANGSVQAFAGGTAVALTTLAGGLVGTSFSIAFGSNSPAITIVGNTITLGTTDISTAFSVPRDSTITDLAAYFQNTIEVDLTDNVTVTAQLYQSAVPSNVFTAIPGAVINMGPITGTITVGQILNGLVNNLSINVTAGTRLIYVFSITADDGISTVTGLASGGVNIL